MGWKDRETEGGRDEGEMEGEMEGEGGMKERWRGREGGMKGGTERVKEEGADGLVIKKCAGKRDNAGCGELPCSVGTEDLLDCAFSGKRIVKGLTLRLDALAMNPSSPPGYLLTSIEK